MAHEVRGETVDRVPSPRDYVPVQHAKPILRPPIAETRRRTMVVS